MGLFGKTPERNPKEQVNEWCRKLRKESSQLERQIRSIQREEDKLKKSLKDAAKSGDKDVCVILAKDVVHARKAISKIYTSKTHITSVQMQMKNQLATLRVAGSLKKSTEVMNAMQTLVRVPEVAATMRELSKEMMRAGIIEEMLDETMSDMEDTEEMEEQAQEEIDKVLWEITQGELGKAPSVVTDSLPSGHKLTTVEVEVAAGPSETRNVSDEEEEEEDEEELEEMKQRLSALRS